MTEGRLIALASAGAVATAAAVIVVWLATLHGAWRLGLPGRRSAVVAWVAGLRATLRRPLPAVWAWLVWVLPALLASAVVPVLGAVFAGLRGGLLLVVVGLLVSLARAFCWVGLFCSFASVTGVAGTAGGRTLATAVEGERERGGDPSEGPLRRSPGETSPFSPASDAEANPAAPSASS